jgi:hypothetical protein
MIGDKTNLYLPVVEIQKMSCLTFAYSLPSNTSGSIQVFQTDVKTGEAKLVRQVSGYHGMRWESTFVQFFPSKDPFKVKSYMYIGVQLFVLVHPIIYTYWLGMRLIALLLFPRYQLFSEAPPRKIVGTEGTIKVLLPEYQVYKYFIILNNCAILNSKLGPFLMDF